MVGAARWAQVGLPGYQALGNGRRDLIEVIQVLLAGLTVFNHPFLLFLQLRQLPPERLDLRGCRRAARRTRRPPLKPFTPRGQIPQALFKTITDRREPLLERLSQFMYLAGQAVALFQPVLQNVSGVRLSGVCDFRCQGGTGSRLTPLATPGGQLSHPPAQGRLPFELAEPIAYQGRQLGHLLVEDLLRDPFPCSVKACDTRRQIQRTEEALPGLIGPLDLFFHERLPADPPVPSSLPTPEPQAGLMTGVKTPGWSPGRAAFR